MPVPPVPLYQTKPNFGGIQPTKEPIIRPGQRKPYVKGTRQQIDERASSNVACNAQAGVSFRNHENCGALGCGGSIFAVSRRVWRFEFARQLRHGVEKIVNQPTLNRIIDVFRQLGTL